MPPALPSYWTAVANIVRERPYGPGGAEIRLGTKHFAPGAKVYIIDWFAGMCERIVVVGLHRKSKRMIKLVIDVRLVENLRASVCYTPAVIDLITAHYSPTRLAGLTQDFAETICEAIPHWQASFSKPSEPAPAASLRAPASSSCLARLRASLEALLKKGARP